MKSFQTDSVRIALLRDGGHKLVGWQDAVVANESADLRPKRNESDQINRAERTQKNPTREKIIRQFDMPAPKPAREPGEKSSVTGDKTIGGLGGSGNELIVLISMQRPLPFGIFRQRPKDPFRAGINCAIRFNELLS